MSCDFSGYLPGAYTITWIGPGDVALTTGGHHEISIADGLNQSQSGGDSPGPSVLSTLTISNVEESDEGIYYCSMIGLSDPQLMESIGLSVSVTMMTGSNYCFWCNISENIVNWNYLKLIVRCC